MRDWFRVPSSRGKQSPWFVPYASTDAALSVEMGYRKFCCPSCHIIIIGYIVIHSDRRMEILVPKFHIIEVILFDLFLIICSYVFLLLLQPQQWSGKFIQDLFISSRFFSLRCTCALKKMNCVLLERLPRIYSSSKFSSLRRHTTSLAHSIKWVFFSCFEWENFPYSRTVWIFCRLFSELILPQTPHSMFGGQCMCRR